MKRGDFDYLLTPMRDDAWEYEPLTGRMEPPPDRRKGAAQTPATPPPTPPERWGGNPRIRVEIEITQRVTPRHGRGYSLLSFVLAVLVLLLLLGATGRSQGQTNPTQWQSYRQGFMTYHQGQDSDGRSWTGQSFTNGDGTRQFERQGPDGEMVHCRSYELSGVTHTECNQ